jgi:hypothetical protein
MTHCGLCNADLRTKPFRKLDTMKVCSVECDTKSDTPVETGTLFDERTDEEKDRRHRELHNLARSVGKI